MAEIDTPTGDSPDDAASAKAAPRRVVEVGWLVDSPQAGFIYRGPGPVGRKAPPPRSAKAASLCPAVLDHEARYDEIPCPFDLHLKLSFAASGRPQLTNVAGAFSTIDQAHLDALMRFREPFRWSAPDRPILQIDTPYRFIADEEVWLEQMPPFNAPVREAWPGVFRGERFPIDIWPRMLTWAFEWQDPDRELIIKRGEPWFYICFETADPTRPVRLVEAEMTERLRDYCRGVDGIVDFADRDFFDTARARRPKALLQKMMR